MTLNEMHERSLRAQHLKIIYCTFRVKGRERVEVVVAIMLTSTIKQLQIVRLTTKM